MIHLCFIYLYVAFLLFVPVHMCLGFIFDPFPVISPVCMCHRPKIPLILCRYFVHLKVCNVFLNMESFQKNKELVTLQLSLKGHENMFFCVCVFDFYCSY